MTKKTASAAITSVSICLAIAMITSVVFEYMRLVIISNGVKDAVRSAVVSSVVSNYDDAYSQLREGYSGGYVYSDEGFTESIDTGNVMNRLDDILALSDEGGKHTKYTDSGDSEYSISNLRIQYENTSFAQGNADRNLKATVYLDIEMSMHFAGRELPPVKYTIKVMAEYMPKF